MVVRVGVVGFELGFVVRVGVAGEAGERLP